MTVYLAPGPLNVTQFIPGGNTPAAGAQWFSYAAGSSTKVNVYTTSSGSVAWSNPIVLDSGGNLTGSREVWLISGQVYDFTLAPSNDTDPPASPYFTVQSISGINDTSSAQSEWVTSSSSPTFVNASTFTLTNDQTSTFAVNRRIKTLNTSGLIYSTITSAAFATSTTTIGVSSDSGGLDSGLTTLSYGLITPTNNSLPHGNYTVSTLFASVVNTSSLNFSTSNISSAGGNFTIGGSLTLTPTSSKVIPGATQLSLRNHADSADNLLITDAGNITARGTIAGTNIPLGVVPNRTSSDQSVTSQTVLQNVSNHSFAIAASEEWTADFYLDTGAALSVTGIKIGLNVPAGASMNLVTALVEDSTSGTNANALMLRTTTVASSLTYSAAQLGGTGDAFIHASAWVLNSTTAGSVQLQYAQATSSTTATTIRRGSHNLATRIA